MAGERASASAEVVALARAIESQRPPAGRLFEDPLAHGFLRPSYRAVALLCRIRLLRGALLGAVDRAAPGMRGFCLGRTCFIDAALRASLARGVHQIVILGAGYDSRPYRIPGIERARVFEVDLPSTQARKRRGLERMLGGLPGHVTLVPIDFARQQLAEELPRAGFRTGQRSFFVLEGVTEHLSETEVDAVLRFVARCAGPGSAIVFTYLDRGVINGSRGSRRTRLVVARSRFGREPLSFGFAPDELAPYLRERGLELLEDVGGREHAARYFEPRQRKVRASPYFRAALARVRGAAAGEVG